MRIAGAAMALVLLPFVAEHALQPEERTETLGKSLYSPGGRQNNIWRVPILSDRPATSADAQQLTFQQGHYQFVDVSRDGRWLLFSSDRSGNQDIWRMPAGGGEIQQITNNPAPDWQPRWSPDGRSFAFYSGRTANRDIWVMPVDGGPAREVTYDESVDWFPSWSPDGQMLAFVSDRSGNWDIWVVPVEGGEARQLTRHSAFDALPEWSVDGTWVYFASTRTGGWRLWRVPSAGGKAEPVTSGPGNYPRASLDGRSILFKRSGDIWAVSLEDGAEHPVTDLEGRPGNVGGGLATDGQYLYFTGD